MQNTIATLLLIGALLGGAGARAQPLIADLSDHLITITSNYSGTKLLLFGSREGEGDVVVVVRGPAQALVVRRKDRVAGVWVNRSSLAFRKVPGFYAVAASRPLGEFATEALLARLGIGTAYLALKPEGEVDDAAEAPFREAVIRNMRRAGLYRAQTGKVTWLGGRLFRTEIAFPANVPVGNYTAEVYLIEANEVVSAQNTPLFIRKTGIERAVFDYAQEQPLLYGIAAVVIAIAMGWLASVVFRRA